MMKTKTLDDYTKLLFNHTFDVDDVILALCGSYGSVCFLNTQQGCIEDEPSASESHNFEITALPLTFIHELKTHEKRTLLEKEDLNELDKLLADMNSPSELPNYFAPTHLGGWLRERAKEKALDWLDQHNLVPPSMRDINSVRASADRFKKSGTSSRVQILES